MKKSIAASTIFILFLISGGAWITLARWLPEGTPRTAVIIILGVAFVSVFLWLLIDNIRKLLGGLGTIWVRVGLASLHLILLILAFAWVYSVVGIIDNTPGGPKTVTDFASCIYYSVVTFTTVGYGDFYPQGIGRFLAALEGLTGYLILGILASTGASLLSPREHPFRDEEMIQ